MNRRPWQAICSLLIPRFVFVLTRWKVDRYRYRTGYTTYGKALMLPVIFDRYVIRMFVRVAVLCFFSTAGLYCVIDAFNNMDELVGLGKQLGGLHAVLMEYYGARLPWFFDRGSGLIALIAAMCVLHSLQRTQELTAVMAAGVPLSRLIRPLIIAAGMIAVLAVANRELVLPIVRDRLVRSAQDWLGQSAQPVQPTTDIRTDILLNGKAVYVGDRRIEKPSFQLYVRHGEFDRFLQAANAYAVPAAAGRPRGYLLDEVTQPKEPWTLASVYANSQPVILTPHDQDWLKPQQLFVASEVAFEQLAGGSAWRRYSSTFELIRELHNPSLDFGLDTRVTVHSRFVQPFLDMTLFLLGLPLVLTRENRNIFVAIGWSCLLVFIFFLVVVACQGLGSSGYLLSPSLAAWCPLMIFVPIATITMGRVFDSG
jgi:lipopolysaccharide export system permease protein